VDIAVKVSHTWTRPGENLTSDSRKNITEVIRSQGAYFSQLSLNSLLTSDSGTYNCHSTTHSSSNSSFIASSDSETASTIVNAGK